jgi:hypothetical protein
MSENVGASTSRNPKGLHGLYRENFTFIFTARRTGGVQRSTEEYKEYKQYERVQRSTTEFSRKSE